MAAISGAPEFLSPESFSSIKKKLDEIPSDKLSDYTLRKAKNGEYSLEKLSWGEKKVQLLKHNENAKRNITEIVNLTINGFNEGLNVDYHEMIDTVSKFKEFHQIDDGTKSVFKKLGDLWTVKQAGLTIQGFVSVILQIEKAGKEVEGCPISKIAAAINSLEGPSRRDLLSSSHTKELQQARDQLVEAVATRLDSSSYRLADIGQIMEAVEALDKRFQTSDSEAGEKIRQLHAESQKTAAKEELRGEVFRMQESFLKNPWQEAVSLNKKIGAYQNTQGAFFKAAGAQKFGERLEEKVATLLEKPIDDPISISLSQKDLKGSKPLDTSSFEKGEAMTELVESWEPVFSDFTAVVKTFGRGECFDKVEVYLNGQKIEMGPILKECEKKCLEAVPAGPGSDKYQMAKVVFLCDQLLEIAKEEMPGVHVADLKKAIAEIVVVGAIDYNPIGLPNFLLSDVSLCGAFDGHLLQPIEQKHQFSFSQEGKTVSSSITASQGYQFVDTSSGGSIVLSKMQYTSKMTKSFENRDADWKGTLESKKISS